jgi:hypothetical protein
MMRRQTVALCLLPFFLGGCGTSTVHLPESCRVLPGPASESREITVVVDEPVRPERAPLARNEAEAIAFGLLFGTLASVDCEGRLHPRLASEWTSEDGNRLWRIHLRADVVSATHVRDSWLTTIAESRDRIGVIADWVRPERIRVSAPDELTIRFDEPFSDFAWVLAHRALAVRREGSPSASSFDDGYTLQVVGDEATLTPFDTRRAPTIRLTPRGAVRVPTLDEHFDVAMTRDPGFDDATPDLVRTALPADRRYVLLLPQARDMSFLSPEELARRVVGPGAAPIDAPFFGDGHARSSTTATDAPAASATIVCSQTDAVARALAARLAALLSREDGHRWIVDPRTPREYRTMLRTGDGNAFVYVVDRSFAPVRLQWESLRYDAPWVAAEAIVPLVETHVTLLTRPGFGDVSTLWDAVPRFGGAEWTIP